MIESGILNINKPAGMTSHDVIYRVRRATGIKRVGHTGTLDPQATGVLPVCIGSAARITEYLDMDFKTYRCTMVLGKITDTQDIWGEVLEERSTEGITEEAIREAFSGFSGFIDQTPPMYSAVRINGRRLYEYARDGQEVKVKSRRIYIKELEIESIDMDSKEVVFSVECSKGTYIRTICQDVGETLGCGATMTALTRTASGAFKIEDTITLEELAEMNQEEIEAKMLTPDFPLVYFGKVLVDKPTAKSFVDGFHLPLDKCNVIKEPDFRFEEAILDIRDEYKHAYNIYEDCPSGPVFLGVAFYNYKFKKLVADKVFFRGNISDNI
ncbi:MAG: tRNA pseudouridine(55) synthase TruB [Firmicutes bacterium]|nr:tRNA pseudouridine(55) synthase TruB [Bacillota bacterium]